MQKKDLTKRTRDFAIRVFKLVELFPETKASDELTAIFTSSVKTISNSKSDF